MALTEAQMEKALAYVFRKMQEADLNASDLSGIVRWMIENPLPTKAEYQAQLAAWEEEDKAASIAHLQAQLDKLQGE